MTDPASNTNQRSPPLAYPGSYPYVEFEQKRDGSWIRHDVTPNNENYSFGHISGSFHSHTPQNGGHNVMVTGDQHEYVAQGKSETVDRNQHNKVGGSVVDQHTQDHYTEHGGDKIHAVGGQGINVHNGIHFSHSTAGHQYSSAGDHVSDFNDGNHHHNVAGDSVKYIGGTKYEYIGEEKGTYLPNGNFDIKCDSGKYQLSTGSDIIIKSATSITLQVGSTTIIINSNGVTINASNVSFNQV